MIYILSSLYNQNFRTFRFSYAYKEIVSRRIRTADGGDEITQVFDEYFLFTNRHQPAGRISVPQAGTPFGGHPSIGVTYTIQTWAWDLAVKEHLLTFERPLEFFFEDFVVAEVTISAARLASGGIFTQQIEEKIFRYAENGRLAITEGSNYSALAVRSSQLPTSVISLAASATVGPSKPFPTGLITSHVPVSGMRRVARVTKTYSELSPETHQEIIHTSTDLQPNVTEVRVVNSPISQLRRLEVLDPGRFQQRSLEDSEAATAARFSGRVYSNGYLNLQAIADVGVQQVLGAAEADFIYVYERDRKGAFNDVKTLRNALLSNVGILASRICSRTEIRLPYISYVREYIALLEMQRGVSGFGNYGIHDFYPWVSVIAGYADHLNHIFSIIKADIGSVVPVSELSAVYMSQVPAYNSWMAGTVTPYLNLRRLGVGDPGRILREVWEYTLRYQWARVDSALATAYLADNSFSGSITLSDPLLGGLNPGDVLTFPFLKAGRRTLRTVGSSFSASPLDLQFQIQVRRNLIE